jgi:hypothetical protein
MAHGGAKIGAVDFFRLSGFRSKSKKVATHRRANTDGVVVIEHGTSGDDSTHRAVQDVVAVDGVALEAKLKILRDLAGTFVTVVDDYGRSTAGVGIIAVDIPPEVDGAPNPAKVGTYVGGLLSGAGDYWITIFVTMVDTS